MLAPQKQAENPPTLDGMRNKVSCSLEDHAHEATQLGLAVCHGVSGQHLNVRFIRAAA